MSDLNQMRRFEREPARRVFAAEFREASYHFREGTEDKSPTYLLLPTGERCNRLFFVGTMTEKSKSDGDNVYYKVRVLDPTGTFFISAGSYQPEAMHQIASIETPSFVAVVGKPNVYQPSDGRTMVSVRAESVAAVDKPVRDCWILDTAERTLDRLDTPADLPDRVKAHELYPQQDSVWRRMVQEALNSIQI